MTRIYRITLDIARNRVTSAMKTFQLVFWTMLDALREVFGPLNYSAFNGALQIALVIFHLPAVRSDQPLVLESGSALCTRCTFRICFKLQISTAKSNIRTIWCLFHALVVFPALRIDHQRLRQRLRVGAVLPLRALRPVLPFRVTKNIQLFGDLLSDMANHSTMAHS